MKLDYSWVCQKGLTYPLGVGNLAVDGGKKKHQHVIILTCTSNSREREAKREQLTTGFLAIVNILWEPHRF